MAKACCVMDGEDKVMRDILRSTLLVTSLAIAAGAVQASPVALAADGSWFSFNVLDGESGWYTDDLSPLEFSFSSASAFTLRITDYITAGDDTGFKVNGNFFDRTNAVPEDFAEVAFTPDEAFGNPLWSQGSWLFAPGSYTFSGDQARAPGLQGLMAISVLRSQTVPEPSALGLLAVALAGAAFAARRRQQRA